MSTPIERLKALCDRDGVTYPPDATVEQLSALLYALPKHAEAKRLAESLRPRRADRIAWVGSGDYDVEYTD